MKVKPSLKFLRYQELQRKGYRKNKRLRPPKMEVFSFLVINAEEFIKVKTLIKFIDNLRNSRIANKKYTLKKINEFNINTFLIEEIEEHSKYGMINFSKNYLNFTFKIYKEYVTIELLHETLFFSRNTNTQYEENLESSVREYLTEYNTKIEIKNKFFNINIARAIIKSINSRKKV